MKVMVEKEFMTVDLLVWEAYGRQDRRLVERTYERNPGLAALGDFLPLLTVVDLAEPDISLAAPETIRLWS